MDRHGNNVKARVAEFDEVNGNDCIEIGDMLVFSNGACRDRDPLGQLIDPPNNEYERCRQVVRYWETRMQRAKDSFDGLKEHVVTQSKAALAERHAPEPVADAAQTVERLTELKAEVKSCHFQLQKARKALEVSEPNARHAQAARSLNERSAINRQRNGELLSAVQKIKI
jgi:hypothetical protein